jgi:site-specific DNA-methyltransferase (adenine-specific)
MGKEWDRGVPGKEFWEEMLRISKPGAILLCMGGTRTYHILATAVETAGWEIRDCLMWLYGSGFPKSHNFGRCRDDSIHSKGTRTHVEGFEGYGTALKPAWEPIIMAMKPCDGTFAQNAEKWGQAGINIDECRIESNEKWQSQGDLKGGESVDCY